MMNKTWKVILAFVGIFAAGLVVGGLATLRVVKTQTPPRLGSPEQYGPWLMKRLSTKLELTPEQQEKIRPLFEKAAEDLHQMRRKAWVDSQAVIERVDSELMAELTPAQKTKFDRMRDEQRERLQRFTEERNRRLKEIQGRRPAERQPQPQSQPPPPAPPAP